MDFVLSAAATLFIVELDNLKVDTKMVISGVEVGDVGGGDEEEAGGSGEEEYAVATRDGE